MQAEQIYRQVLNSQPNNIYASNYLGVIALQKGYIDAAIDLFNKTIAADPGYADAYNNLGSAYVQACDSDSAIQSFLKAVSLDQSYVEAFYNLATLFEKKNDVVKARDYLDKVWQLGCPRERSLLLEAKILYREENIELALEKVLEIDLSKKDDELVAEILFFRGKMFDHLNKVDEAILDFINANKLARQNSEKNIDGDLFFNEIELCSREFKKEWVQSWSPIVPNPKDYPSPVFLVGFPRSGTTLLDQILGSHPEIDVLEEKPLVDSLIQDLKGAGSYPHVLENLTMQQVEDLREKYWAEAEDFLGKRLPEGGILVDKQPFNITKIGTILRIFPDAKIILALRHPLDVCLSSFMQNFSLNKAMINFTSLAGAANAYVKSIDLWRQYTEVFEPNCHMVKYENVVENFEIEVRELISFLEIEWNDLVLSYHERVTESKKTISTPSFRDVSKPIFSRAKYRWQRYRKHLMPEIEKLSGHIAYFGYKTDYPDI